ncbi:MAG: HAD family acid phosphatase [Tenuifilaceae bacterium]|nr:HAD family acid phosphatase [Tenuifilaceae bacterium]
MKAIISIISVIVLTVLTSNAMAAVVGFDYDDCLCFTTPSFKVEGQQFGTDAFWAAVNGNPAVASPKASVVEILKAHVSEGDEVYVITARPDTGAAATIAYITATFGVAADHIIFAPKGKDGVIKKKGITTFYGDSDSDISDARKGGAEGVRVERAPESSYKSKYSPGAQGERVLKGTMY